jgi:hypothetical protein
MQEHDPSRIAIIEAHGKMALGVGLSRAEEPIAPPLAREHPTMIRHPIVLGKRHLFPDFSRNIHRRHRWMSHVIIWDIQLYEDHP